MTKEFENESFTNLRKKLNELRKEHAVLSLENGLNIDARRVLYIRIKEVIEKLKENEKKVGLTFQNVQTVQEWFRSFYKKYKK